MLIFSDWWLLATMELNRLGHGAGCSLFLHWQVWILLSRFRLCVILSLSLYLSLAMVAMLCRFPSSRAFPEFSTCVRSCSAFLSNDWKMRWPALLRMTFKFWSTAANITIVRSQSQRAFLGVSTLSFSQKTAQFKNYHLMQAIESGLRS